MISVLKIPLGNIFMFRDQNTFAFGCHLIQCLTLKATAALVCLEISQFGSGRNTYWCCLHVNVHLHRGPSTEVWKTCILMWPCNIFIRNVHAQYSSSFRHTTVILEIERNGIHSQVWEEYIISSSTELMYDWNEGRCCSYNFPQHNRKTVLIVFSGWCCPWKWVELFTDFEELLVFSWRVD